MSLCRDLMLPTPVLYKFPSKIGTELTTCLSDTNWTDRLEKAVQFLFLTTTQCMGCQVCRCASVLVECPLYSFFISHYPYFTTDLSLTESITERVTLPARVNGHAPQLSLSPSHDFLSDLIVNTISRSLFFFVCFIAT